MGVWGKGGTLLQKGPSLPPHLSSSRSTFPHPATGHESRMVEIPERRLARDAPEGLQPDGFGHDVEGRQGAEHAEHGYVGATPFGVPEVEGDAQNVDAHDPVAFKLGGDGLVGRVGFGLQAVRQDAGIGHEHGPAGFQQIRGSRGAALRPFPWQSGRWRSRARARG